MRTPRPARPVVLLFALLGLAACAAHHPPPPAQPAAPPPPPPDVVVSVVGTSDLHGHVEPQTFPVTTADGRKQEVERGGLAWLGGYVANLRAVHPVVLVDAGDLFQGTLTSNLGEGQAVIDGYNALGYAAAAIGNHEFDYGPAGPRSVPRGAEDDAVGALKARIAAAHFPFLCANLVDEASGAPAAWPNLYPSRLIEVPGVPGLRLGLIGATSEDTPHTTNALNLRGLRVAPVVPAVKEQAARLRQEGATAIILLVHEGANCKSFADPRDLAACDNEDGRVVGIARQLQGDVDAIVAGHTHAGMAHFVGTVPVIQSFALGRAFGRLDLHFRRGPNGALSLLAPACTIAPPQALCSVAPAGGKHEHCDPEHLAGQALVPASYEGRPVVASAAVAEALRPHVEHAAAARTESLGVTVKDKLARNYRNESSTGDLLADLIREGAGLVSKERVDVAFQNGGGIRADLPQGALKYGDLYEVLPFDNRLALLKLPGKALEELVRANLASSAGVLVPSGMSVEARCEGGTLQVKLRDAAGRPLRPAQKYTVAVSDFLAAGGDNFGPIVRDLPPGSVKYFDDAPPLREIVLQALRRHPTVTAPPADPPRLRLPMPRPVRCVAP